MNITVIYVGGAKDGYISEACAEFEKRIGAYARLSQIELKEFRVGDESSAASRRLAMENEAKRIIEVLPKKSRRIALCVEGKQLSSEELGALIGEVKRTAGELCFVIGSSHGLAEKVKAACDRRLSFSKLTFPHRLMRVILAEALYRALSIDAGGKYHK